MSLHRKMFRKIPLKFQNTKYRGVPPRNWEATKIVDAFFSRKSVSNLLVLLIGACSMLFQKTYNNCLKILNPRGLSNIFEDWYFVSKIVLWIEKCFWDHQNNLVEQWKVRIIRILFNLLSEVSVRSIKLEEKLKCQFEQTIRMWKPTGTS